MKKLKTYSVPIFILAVGFVGMFVLLGMRTDVPRKEPRLRPKVVNTLIAQPEQVPVTVSGLGKVTSTQPVNIFGEVAGTIMAGDVPFRPAQSFKKGDLLLKIDDRQARLNINKTRSDFLTALAGVLAEIKSESPDEYQNWLDYFHTCDFDNRLRPLPDTDNQRIQMLLTRFNVYKLFFSIQDLEITLDKHFVYAPFDGSIVVADMRVGSTVRSGSLLGTIVNLEDLEVELPVTTDDINWINVGAKARLISNELGSEWTGKVSRVGQTINPMTQSVSVFIKVDKTQRQPLLSGIYLTAEIAGTAIDNAVTVPRQALYSENQLYLIKDGKLESREVEIVRKQFDSVILSKGLSRGDTVIVDLMQGVVPGIPVASRQ